MRYSGQSSCFKEHATVLTLTFILVTNLQHIVSHKNNLQVSYM